MVPKSPPEIKIEETTKSPDADQREFPDLTPETAEPDPSSGEAGNPINLADEADASAAPIPESYQHLEKYMEELCLTTTAPTYTVEYPMTHPDRDTIDDW